MQRIVLNKGLLTELARCDRSFVMSLYYHNLDNATLSEKGTFDVNDPGTYEIRKELIYKMSSIADAISRAGGITTLECGPDDEIWLRVRKTWDAIQQGGPLFIVDGALEGDDFIVPFAILFIREDGYWEVYHMSTKSQSTESRKDRREMLKGNMEDAAPLMYVLSQAYADKVVKFGIIGADKTYTVPYPDPETGEIHPIPDDAMMFVDLTDVLLFPDPPKLYKSIRDMMPGLYDLSPEGADTFSDEWIEEDFCPRLSKCVSAAQARSVIWSYCREALGWPSDYCVEFKEAFAAQLVDEFSIDYASDLSEYLGVENPHDKIDRIESQIAADPFWIPEVDEMDSRCKNPYPCPFFTYCKARKDVDHVSFYLPYHDAKKLADNGYPLMQDVLDLSYEFPTLTGIPREDGRPGTFDISEIALRELRSYEFLLEKRMRQEHDYSF